MLAGGRGAAGVAGGRWKDPPGSGGESRPDTGPSEVGGKRLGIDRFGRIGGGTGADCRSPIPGAVFPGPGRTFFGGGGSWRTAGRC